MCVAIPSSSMKVMVVPDATVIIAGEKLDPEPAPCGMITVAIAPLLFVLEVEDVVVITVLLVVVVLLVVLLVVVRLLEEVVVVLPLPDTVIVPFIQ